MKISNGSLIVMDLIDRMNEQWKQVRPDLDPSPLEVVGRVIVLAQALERSVNAALEKHGLTLGQFDILATLRRLPDGKLTPTQLMQSVVLSSGGMTNRLDRLQDAGWIRREADPDDRRGVVIALTTKGRALIDDATETRLAEANASMPPLGPQDTQNLADYLRNWLISIGESKKVEPSR